MNPATFVECPHFPCGDVVHARFTVPSVVLRPSRITVMMVAEAPPGDPADWFYAAGNPFYLNTTLGAFRAAGCDVASMRDIIGLGIYLTTAIKCAKQGNAVEPASVRNCSPLLEQELAAFHDLVAILAMGDVAIKAINNIARRRTGKPAIPSGPTYKIRSGEYYLGDLRVFPSYLQTGKSYLIEKSKQAMIAADIRAALAYAADAGA